jgi:threonine dehydrogenase-like Zn-dependent dehydrogenase
MKAAVFYGAHDFRVEDVPEPRIEPTDILIKVKSCGICGSDLHAYKEGLFSRPGFIMGHELSGEVAEVGSGVKDIKVGDRVVPMLIPFNEFLKGCGECFWCLRGQPQWCPTNIHKPCGECDYCKSGQFWMCDKMQRHLLLGYSRNGGYSEYVTVPDAQLNVNFFKVPDTLSWEEAAFVEPLWGAYRWVMMANPQTHDVAVVIGLGTIGLLVMEVMKLYASKVIVTEISDKRLQLAKELGADATINAKQEDPVKKIIELTGSGRSYAGKGGGCADIVMECSGAGIALRQAMDMTRTGGRIVLIGLFEEDVPINANLIIHKQLSLISSFGWGTGKITKEISESMKLLAERKVNVKPLISHEFPVSGIMDAFEAQTRPDEAVKVLIKPEM